MFAVILMLLTQAPVASDPTADERDYPPLSDLKRFPSLSTAEVQSIRYGSHACHLEGLRAAWPYRPAYIDIGDLERAIQISREREKAWRMLYRAANERDDYGSPRSEFYRRDWLNDLRMRLGPDDYEAGRMPPLLVELTYP